jgi:hypothetical protein
MGIDLRYFIVSLAIGIFYVYLTHDPHAIILYPTPENEHTTQYRKSGECHSYKLEEIKCPSM